MRRSSAAIGATRSIDRSPIALRLDQFVTAPHIEVTVELEIEGESVAAAHGSAALGHPLRVPDHVARHARTAVRSLRSGQLVITGTCTGLVAARNTLDWSGEWRLAFTSSDVSRRIHPRRDATVRCLRRGARSRRSRRPSGASTPAACRGPSVREPAGRRRESQLRSPRHPTP